MKVNFVARTIEMSAKEMRKASVPYPTYTVEIKAPAKRKNEYKGLTYDYMKSYIKEHDDGDGKKMEQFLSLIGQDKDGKIEDTEVAGYLDVKDWFLKQFPEIKKAKETRRDEIKKILASAA